MAFWINWLQWRVEELYVTPSEPIEMKMTMAASPFEAALYLVGMLAAGIFGLVIIFWLENKFEVMLEVNEIKRQIQGAELHRECTPHP